MRDGKNGYSDTPEFNFLPLGKAIKRAREKQGVTREQLAEMLDYAPRHIQAIENEGQHPSFQLLTQLATMFGVSVDAYLFPDRSAARSELRSRIDTHLDGLTEQELMVVESVIDGLERARKHNTPTDHNKGD